VRGRGYIQPQESETERLALPYQWYLLNRFAVLGSIIWNVAVCWVAWAAAELCGFSHCRTDFLFVYSTLNLMQFPSLP
jgi:hypothetical protein